jgi:16S rRNA (cytidine1402-2'-O)-methyltransferase
VLVLAGNAVETVSDSSEMDSVLVPLLSELPLKQAVALAVKITGSPRNALYQRALELQDKTD